MTESHVGGTGSGTGTGQEEPELLRHILRGPGYPKVLVFCALIGIPVSLAAFWFLVGLHELEHALWAGLPQAMGLDGPPWWWPLPLLLVAGTAIGLIVTHLSGGGGADHRAVVRRGTAMMPVVILAAVVAFVVSELLPPGRRVPL
ncbi:hypothetical protein J7E99_34720 [Streptomyces sp. ISL-44]|uniref:hypothetical protein n=1 Tax=Streptomyces sp. ISL-44 TaxID=2819184 RepID=UPI001BEB09C3|nr:hypothetical protein [Streptomyces sp. ISL-44]MBT2545700.1 hypothetical protein [Streptomyces sp. ISL-44]